MGNSGISYAAAQQEGGFRMDHKEIREEQEYEKAHMG